MPYKVELVDRQKLEEHANIVLGVTNTANIKTVELLEKWLNNKPNTWRLICVSNVDTSKTYIYWLIPE